MKARVLKSLGQTCLVLEPEGHDDIAFLDNLKTLKTQMVNKECPHHLDDEDQRNYTLLGMSFRAEYDRGVMSSKSAARCLIASINDEAGDAIRHLQEPRGGQHVSFHGDFAGCSIQGLKRIKWWMRELTRVLESGS